MIKSLTFVLAAAAIASGAAWAHGGAPAAPDGEQHRRGAETRGGAPRTHPHGAKLMHAVIGNLTAEQLAARTGRSADEVRSMLKNDGPRGTARELGLDRDQMREVMVETRQVLITRLGEAGLLTPSQVETIAARPHRHHAPEAD